MSKISKWCKKWRHLHLKTGFFWILTFRFFLPAEKMVSQRHSCTKVPLFLPRWKKKHVFVSKTHAKMSHRFGHLSNFFTLGIKLRNIWDCACSRNISGPNSNKKVFFDSLIPSVDLKQNKKPRTKTTKKKDQKVKTS